MCGQTPISCENMVGSNESNGQIVRSLRKDFGAQSQPQNFKFSLLCAMTSQDPKRRRFYYYDTVKDESSWVKPKLLRKSDLQKIAPTYTVDQAAILIQRQLWRRRSLIRVRVLYKNTITVHTDEESNAEYYYNPKTDHTAWELPKFMGGKLDHGYEERFNKKRGVKGKGEDSDDEIDDDEADKDSDDDDDDSELDDPDSLEKRRLARKYPR